MCTTAYVSSYCIVLKDVEMWYLQTTNKPFPIYYVTLHYFTNVFILLDWSLMENLWYHKKGGQQIVIKAYIGEGGPKLWKRCDIVFNGHLMKVTSVKLFKVSANKIVDIENHWV